MPNETNPEDNVPESDRLPEDVQITSEPATDEKSARVSILVDGERRYTVRSSDLEDIGAQLRGKKSFSVFYTIVLPALAVFISTGIAQTFQYISWRNETRLKETTARVEAAKEAYEEASKAISGRYYATLLYLNATLELNANNHGDDRLQTINTKFDQKSFDDYNGQMKNWTTSYDQILSDIDFHMDRPLLWNSERVSTRLFKSFDCTDKTMLLSEMQRLKLDINSLKVQFAAINYCFKTAMQPYKDEIRKALAEKEHYTIPPTEKRAAAKRLIHVRAMSNEFRCFAQHRIALFDREKRRAIFKLQRWIGEKISALFRNPEDARRADLRRLLDRAVEDCNFTKPMKRKSRFAS